mmetsp:Transcript_125279/g.304194  ORF Transcript_125279/g.304194 Transcript_125279/m.304194 type:complete len:258 (-) Transcript_125279:332-1105(-)
MERTASSFSRSMCHMSGESPSLSSLFMDSRNLLMLPENRLVDVCAMRDGRLVYPIHVIPFSVTYDSPGLVVVTLPPASAARSTVTPPRGMAATILSLIRTGAFMPGMSAVVMITSVFAHSFSSILSAAANHSADISFAYPPAPEPSSSKSTLRNLAPIASTCSAAAARTSNDVTMAPRFLAAWMAASPATPAPTTMTRVGGILPAAVDCPANGRCRTLPASMTARYPAMLACDDSTSNAWPRDSVRSSMSMENAVAP